MRSNMKRLICMMIAMCLMVTMSGAVFAGDDVLRDAVIALGKTVDEVLDIPVVVACGFQPSPAIIADTVHAVHDIVCCRQIAGHAPDYFVEFAVIHFVDFAHVFLKNDKETAEFRGGFTSKYGRLEAKLPLISAFYIKISLKP